MSLIIIRFSSVVFVFKKHEGFIILFLAFVGLCGCISPGLKPGVNEQLPSDPEVAENPLTDNTEASF